MDPETLQRLCQAEQRICQLWAATLHLQAKCLPPEYPPVRTGSVSRVTVKNPVGGRPIMGLGVGLSSLSTFLHTLTLTPAPRMVFGITSRASFVGAPLARPAPKITFGLSSVPSFVGTRIASPLASIDYALSSSNVFAASRPGLVEADYALSSVSSFAGSSPGFAVTASNDASFGTQPWTNPTFAQGPPDGAFATNAYGTPILAQGLLGSAYGFAVPAGATVVGVSVGATIFDNSGNANTNTQVQLSHLGALIGAAKTITPFVPVASSLVTLGSSSDLWGAALTPAIVGDPSFGAEIVPGGSLLGASLNVDSIEVTVFYTLP
jgi:hypothetical protein